MPVSYSARQSPVWLWLIFCGIGSVGPFIWLSEGGHPALISTLFFPVVFLSLFQGMKVEVDANQIHLSFGVGIIRRKIRMDSIESAAIVRNSWWYGWGIRLTPHGWMWNISGLDAVELIFKNGKKFRIGTGDPNGLLKALELIKQRNVESR
ncbi:MAG: hypothetical protein QGH51_01530 [Planctomycetota bacterium]|jgi:hypothetical protein|nr:hypothetical protein [Planctomycetota bacterium]MDP6940682.1 hypothetical protein [Planctomycetota bacterium]